MNLDKFQEALGDKYIIQVIHPLHVIEICRVKDVWNSEDGSDILLARVSFQAYIADHHFDLPRQIIREMYYDRMVKKYGEWDFIVKVTNGSLLSATKYAALNVKQRS